MISSTRQTKGKNDVILFCLMIGGLWPIGAEIVPSFQAFFFDFATQVRLMIIGKKKMDMLPYLSDYLLLCMVVGLHVYYFYNYSLLCHINYDFFLQLVVTE